MVSLTIETCVPWYYKFHAKTLKRKWQHFHKIVVTGYTGSCQNDNFQCSQWWKFHENDNHFSERNDNRICFWTCLVSIMWRANLSPSSGFMTIPCLWWFIWFYCLPQLLWELFIILLFAHGVLRWNTRNDLDCHGSNNAEKWMSHVAHVGKM